MKGLFVTGTDTNVGKTWVGQHLIPALCKKGIEVIPRKPIESGWDEDNEENSDAWKLANAANQLDQLDNVCPNRFSHPISPVRAAAIEGVTLSIAKIKDQCINNMIEEYSQNTPPHFYMTASNNNKNTFLYVEGAGGFYSPLCADGLNADLACALELPVLLIAENRLGCINQVLLTVEAIKRRGLVLSAIVLNDTSNKRDSADFNSEMNNHKDLLGMVSCPIVSIQHNQNKSAFDNLALLILELNKYNLCAKKI